MPDDCEVCAGDCGGAVGTVSFDFPGVRMSVPFGQECLDAVVRTMARQWNYAVARQNEATNAWAAMLGLDFSAGGASPREGEDQAGATVQPGPPAEVPMPLAEPGSEGGGREERPSPGPHPPSGPDQSSAGATHG